MALWLRAASLPVLGVVMLAFFASLTLVSVAIGFLYERLLRHRRIWNLPLKRGQLAFEARSNVPFVFVQAAAFTGALGSGLLRLSDGGSALLTAAAMHVVFQLYYYGLHRAMHHPALLRIHRHHHFSQVTTPLSGQSVSIAEALGWALGYVGAPLLLSQVVEVSALGVASYLAFNVYGNIVGHANFEVLRRPLATSHPLALFVPPFLFHALHHARWTGHYGFAGAWTDRVFRTEWSDWSDLEGRIQDGTPLASLKERGTSRSRSARRPATARPLSGSTDNE